MLVPDFTFRDQLRLNGHHTNKNGANSEAHEGQLPTPHHRPKQAYTHHSQHDHELGDDDSHQRSRIIRVFNEGLYDSERGRRMGGRDELGLVLREHAGVCSVA